MTPRITLLESLRRLRDDYRGYLRIYRKKNGLSSLVNFLFYPGLWAAGLYRLSHWLHARGLIFRLPARLVYWANHILTGVDINPAAEIGGGLVMLHTSGQVLTGRFGRDVLLTVGVKVGGNFDRTDIGAGPGLPVVGDGVVFGTNCTVLGPIRIGDRAFVSAASFVGRDVPAGMTVFGVPARVVGPFRHPILNPPPEEAAPSPETAA